MENYKNISSSAYNSKRIKFLKNCPKDFSLVERDSNILISAPHAVSQNRLGKLKVAEIGTASISLILSENLKTNLIIKTSNEDDDANFDANCKYRKQIKKLLKEKEIKYLIDFHGLAKHRECDINLGINFGNNIKNNIPLFDKLQKELIYNGFKVFVDNPFSGGPKTVSGTFAKTHNIWTIQIEINSKITNEKEQIDKLNLLIKTLLSVFKNVE